MRAPHHGGETKLTDEPAITGSRGSVRFLLLSARIVSAPFGTPNRSVDVNNICVQIMLSHKQGLVKSRTNDIRRSDQVVRLAKAVPSREAIAALTWGSAAQKLAVT